MLVEPNSSLEMEQKKPFMSDSILAESNLVCAFARAQKIIESEESPYETRGQARAFLMEIYGKLETIHSSLVATRDEAQWHPQHLQTIVHLLQGSLSMNLGEFPNAENELKV